MSSGSSLADAEDIAQEVFLRALRQVGERRAPENLFAWLVASAKNAVIDRFRRQRHEVAPSPGQWAELEYRLSDLRASGDQTLIERERYSWVLEAVGSLGETERRCLLLRSEGVTFREIAKLLGIPLRTAAYHTNAAIEKLQRRVKA
jgi:RNA polymerase sigma-70 factor (ECF subfamily)